MMIYAKESLKSILSKKKKKIIKINKKKQFPLFYLCKETKRNFYIKL